MKASLRHSLSVPSTLSSSSSSSSTATDRNTLDNRKGFIISSLKERILNSTAPLANDDDDGLINHGTTANSHGNGNDNGNANANANGNIKTNTKGTKVIKVKIKKQSEAALALASASPSHASGSAPASSTPNVIAIHPTEPILCQVLQSDILHQSIVIQNYIQNRIIAQINLVDILKKWLDSGGNNNGNSSSNNNSNGNDKKQRQANLKQTCLNLGYITSIQFMDQQVLFYNSGRTPVSTPTSASMPYLILQFAKGIILYKHNQQAGFYKYTPMINITQPKLNNALPTSRPMPILSTNLLAIGCSDGAMRFYSIQDKKVVKSVRGPNGRQDPVVAILAVQPWIHQSRPTSTLGHAQSYVDNNIKIATVCSSGTAYIWELQISFHPKSGKIYSFKIKSPIVKLDLYRYIGHMLPFSSTNGNGGSNSGNVSNTGGSASQSRSKMDKFKVKFDPDRDLLYWTIQSGSGSGGSHSKILVVVWEWNYDAILKASKRKMPVEKNGAKAKSQAQGPMPSETPTYLPSTITQIPNITNGGKQLLLSNVIPGLIHPSFSDESIMSLVVSQEGDIYVIGAKRNGIDKNDDNDDDGGNGHDRSSTAELSNEMGVVYHKFNFKALCQSAGEKVLGYLRHVQNGKLQVSSIINSCSRPDLIILVTNVGLLVVNLVLDEEALLTGSHHASFVVGRGGNGLISVQSSKVFASLIVAPSSSRNNINIGTMNPVGKLMQRNQILVYESPPSLHKSLDFQSRPVRVPPRLLPSPSGKFLCLFWHKENRYEILYMDSLTSAIKRPLSKHSFRDVHISGFSPAVDTGFDVLSFAWVGDDDVFALLYPPELKKDQNNVIVKIQTTVDVLGTRSSSTGQENYEDENVVYDPDKFKPRVELKVLVGVNADAVELSGSIAAATATFLGTIMLRGRHAPTCLFGGPVLCVGSFSQDKATSQRDGMAYFYTRREGSSDNRASSYASVGPALPYPDLVVWDDEGGLCAIIVGRRIAIYRSHVNSFMLLGTAYLGTDSDIDTKVYSAKFIHSVLYCATEKSIQCIFLGDLSNSDVICEIDSFTLAAVNAPIIPSSPLSITPTHEQTSLLWPSILGYHQGSLLVSSTNGVHTVSLAQPLFRLGALLAAGQVSKVQRWIDAIHPSQHEFLAEFLFRRGFPALATGLSGLSLETMIKFRDRNIM